MTFILSSALAIAFIILVICFAQKVERQSYLGNELRVRKESELLARLEKLKNDLYKDKRAMEEEAFKIFTLYEITREITKTLTEQDAFEVFQSKLREHVRFEECRLLGREDVDIRKLRKNKEYFVFTLKGKRKNIGYLVIKHVPEEDKEKVMILGHQFALALRRVKLYREIEKVAVTDGLTDVYTRRFVLERLQEEIKRSRLRKIKMSFLMIDVDHFKDINDQYGHLTGDNVLGEIGGIIKENIREIDIPGRFGGEEFCVILPDTDPDGARYAAERIRRSAEKAAIKAYDNNIDVTVSIGIATYPKDGSDMDEIIDKADWTLYKAKKQGRNRVCSFGVHD